MTSLPEPFEQTPAQWAVRWHGIVLAAVLLASVPIVHVFWHGVLGHDTPMLRTRSQMPAPKPTTQSILWATPSWMDQKERQLREDSPITWWLRSTWNEVRYGIGMPQSTQVHFGSDEWFFIQEAVWPDLETFRRAAPNRQRFFAEVRDLVRAAGAELFVVVLPDKARVYAERCYADGAMPAGKSDNYAVVLAELGALGIPTADVAAAMASARAANPGVELYYRRDTHWRPQGALLAGQVVAAAIEQRFGDRLQPRVPATLRGPSTARLVPDLVAMASFATLEIEESPEQVRSAPMSILTDRLAEVREYYGLELHRPAGTVAVDGTDPDAEVLLLGASFAHENGLQALALGLGRSVRGCIRMGAGGFGSLQATLPELRAGTKAKVVVWELVERGFSTRAWLDPRL